MKTSASCFCAHQRVSVDFMQKQRKPPLQEDGFKSSLQGGFLFYRFVLVFLMCMRH